MKTFVVSKIKGRKEREGKRREEKGRGEGEGRERAGRGQGESRERAGRGQGARESGIQCQE